MAYKRNIIRVKGKKVGEILIFALSTCGWCMKAKKLLDNLKVEYSYIDVDLLSEIERKEVKKEFEKYNTNFTFPKIIINNRIISGFNEDKIRATIK